MEPKNVVQFSLELQTLHLGNLLAHTLTRHTYLHTQSARAHPFFCGMDIIILSGFWCEFMQKPCGSRCDALHNICTPVI